MLADFSDFRFSGVDKATCGVVGEAWFVIFKGDEGFSFGSDIDTVI